MRRRFALLLLVVGGACGGDDPTQPFVMKPPPDPDRDGDGILNAVDFCPDQPETFNGALDNDGCPDVTNDLYVLARDVIEQYWDQVVFTDGSYSTITVFQDYSTPITTPCGPAILNNAIYCPANAGVYYHLEFLDTWLNDIGDMAPVFILAHEVGHHVGIGILGWIAGQVLTPLGTVLTLKETELMADCFAGAFTAAANLAGLLEEGDLDETVIALVTAGDVGIPWFDPTGHGTAGQRIDAFNLGFAQGVGSPAACTDTNFFAAFPTPPRDE